MFFLANMVVNIPHNLPEEEVADLLAAELAYSQRLQKKGKITNIWRVVGEYANYSIFQVKSNEELHNLLSNLPLYPYMNIKVTPLSKHPSCIK